MSAREWKPGDVAVITIAALGERRAIYTEHGRAPWQDECGAHWNESVIDVRPLVVIDPEDREQVERLTAAVPRQGRPFADEMQAALRSLVTDPKPDEPTGLGAVVEDTDGNRWVRVSPDAWQREEREEHAAYLVCHWVDVFAVRVLSEGVTS